MDRAIDIMTKKGAMTHRSVPLITLSEIMKDSGVEDFDDLLGP